MQAYDTKRTRRNILNRWTAEFGGARLAHLDRKLVQKMVDERADRPSAARNFLNTLRALMTHCLRFGMIASDPTVGVTRPQIKTRGYHTWSESEIETYRQHHQLGSRERLAMELLLNLGQRRNDIRLLGRQHLRDGRIFLSQKKTDQPLELPILPELAAALATVPADNMTFLLTKFGKPFSAAGFGNVFRDWCNAAGLPQCTSHGLRKACCRRLAEAGCSANLIAAVSGHRDPRMVAHYTREADQARMARMAMEQMSAVFPPTRTSGGNGG